VVLCVHGLTRNSRDFADLAPHLVARGWRVVAVDVRGRGLSGHDPVSMNYAVPTYVADIWTVMDALRIESVVWIGTSMGGLIAMVAAATGAARMRAVVLNDITPDLSPVGLARIAGYVGALGSFAGWAEAADAVRATNETAFPGREAAFWDAFARRVCREAADGRVHLDYDPDIAVPFRAAPAPAVDLHPLFAALPTPLVLVRGALSDLVSAGERDAALVTRPDMQVVEVPGVGHAPLLTEPEALEAILGVLDAVG